MEKKKAYLILENGTVFEGYRFGSTAPALGELVFTTNMCGYIETLTDPNYFGQIILQTFPLIGNYGMIEEDLKGNCYAKGYVVRNWCEHPSNFRCQYDLDTFLKNQNIPGIYGVDTRAITKIIRENGVMNAMIADQIPSDFTALKDYRIIHAVQQLSCKKIVVSPAIGEEKYHVVLMDFGAKHNIVRELNKRNCKVSIVPANTSAEKILSLKPDGLMLSNGPGDPAENEEIIRELSLLLGKLPIFGIGLGHQLLALANGGKTIKLKYGHRGASQPVKDLSTGRCYITSQNHGYAVLTDTLANTKTSFENVNDHTCEGIHYLDIPAFSVQFDPEACAGPHDTSFLFDSFVAMMGGNDNAI